MDAHDLRTFIKVLDVLVLVVVVAVLAVLASTPCPVPLDNVNLAGYFGSVISQLNLKSHKGIHQMFTFLSFSNMK